MRKKLDYKHLIEDVCGFTCENDNYSKPLPSLKAQDALNELCDYFLGEERQKQQNKNAYHVPQTTDSLPNGSES